MATTNLPPQHLDSPIDELPPEDLLDETLEEEDDAEVLFRKPRSLEDAEMDITPMIDITFLLLIFFLVASKMDTSGDVTLPAASHAAAVSLDNAVILTIAQGAGDEAIVYKGDNQEPGNRVAGGDPDARADEIAAYVDRVFVGEAKEYVLIKAAADVKHRDVAQVAEAVAKSDAAQGSDRMQTLHVAVLEEN